MTPNNSRSISIPFVHRQSAHCETGVLSNLLSHEGLKISEAMVFGIGGGLFYGYFPFIRLNKLPLIAYRNFTGAILKRTTKRLGVRLKWEKFRSPDKAMEALDRHLEDGIPVGCRAGAYWLNYFPPRYRFHFNMHNLVAFGRNERGYLVSDPVMPEPVECPPEDLRKARFAKGPMPPKGRMYHVVHIPENPDWMKCIAAGIRDVCRTMLKAPGPFLGVKGMRYLAKKIEKWPLKMEPRRAILHLGQIIRMQEEIGTGGGGFRYIFAAFLQEAAEISEIESLSGLSDEMTSIGDQWREFALVGSRICKGRNAEAESFSKMADILRDCAGREESLLRKLEAVDLKSRAVSMPSTSARGGGREAYADD